MARPKWLLLVAATMFSGCRSVPEAAPPPRAAAYADASSCAPCHAKIWETYKQTGMGRSFARVTGGAVPQGAVFHHKPSGLSYTVSNKDGKLYQRRHQMGFDGKETNAAEKEIHFVLGSGNHSRTYLHRRADGRLIELPLGWYAEKKGYWAMNPGFDRPDHDDFRREINFQCLFCHNGYPAVAAGADDSGTAPVYPETLPEGIDCQRCHGPGAAHVAAMKAGGPSKDTILNPAKLSKERQLEVCMQCHLETTSFRLPGAIVRYDRPLFSYRPGEPLGAYILHFDRAGGAGDRFEIAHAAYRMRQSACFQKSGGAMVCTTCHDPHARGSRYRAACAGCHKQALDGLIAARRHTGEGDCQRCHMPSRRTDDVVHVAMTDHYIQRRPPGRDLLAPREERRETDGNSYRGEVALYYPPNSGEELYTAVAQVRQGANLAGGIPRLEAAIRQHKPAQAEFYFELAEAYRKTGQSDAAIAMYEQAVARKPRLIPAVRGLAATLGRAGRLAQGAEVLKKATGLGVEDAGMWNDLALLQMGLGDAAGARDSLGRALRLNPEYPEAHNNLGGLLVAGGDRAGAEAAFRSAILAQPDLAEARRNLANLLAETRFAEAEYHFRQAIAADAGYALAWFDYGMALARREQFAKAREQFEGAVRADPKMAEAQNALGDMLAMSGNGRGALEAYRKAVEAKPDFAAALVNLAQALVHAGRAPEAKPYLERALRVSADPELQRAASEMLGRMR